MMTKTLLKREYKTPLTKVCSADYLDMLCQSAIDTSVEGFTEDETMPW